MPPVAGTECDAEVHLQRVGRGRAPPSALVELVVCSSRLFAIHEMGDLKTVRNSNILVYNRVFASRIGNNPLLKVGQYYFFPHPGCVVVWFSIELFDPFRRLHWRWCISPGFVQTAAQGSQWLVPAPDPLGPDFGSTTVPPNQCGVARGRRFRSHGPRGRV